MTHAFAGTPRYRVERRLGEGGMGVVYRAFDRDRDIPVAIKVLRQQESAALYRFKREFRALADVTHPNLVTLYELVSSGEYWFFTMELLEGVDFFTYVRGAPSGNDDTTRVVQNAPQPATPTARPKTPTLSLDQPTRPLGKFQPNEKATLRETASPMVVSADQLKRLKFALGELTLGIMALHSDGKLHRDIKPSNVQVTHNQRVVLLDFGIVAELRQSGVRPAESIGTPAYMAPEQAAGELPQPESDWYSVGVMIFEALCGLRPFMGPSGNVLRAKQLTDAPDIRELVKGVPEPICALCMDLLHRDPDARPTGPEVLSRLGLHEGPILAELGQPPFVGRAQQIKALAQGLNVLEQGSCFIVSVHGTPGVGKSALVRHFLEELRLDPGTVVLAGRCFERESVPYKALDGLVDTLGHYLDDLSPEGREKVLPRGFGALSRLFPVLSPIGAHTNPAEFSRMEPVELRRRAFTALRELLRTIGRQHRLVMHIDDLQWGDADSAQLLIELFRGEDRPLAMFVLSHRVHHPEHNPILQSLLESLPSLVPLPVGPLTEAESEELAQHYLRLAGGPAKLASKVAVESRGNPFFVAELCRHLLANSNPELGHEINLADIIHRRVQALPESDRTLLEIIGVAGQPMAQGTAQRAAEMGPEFQRALARLRTANLIRLDGLGEDDPVETYHDRVREVVVERLPHAISRHHHHRLALALAATKTASPEKLGDHFFHGGDNNSAAQYYARAAVTAEESLAFDRAASLYARCLHLRRNRETGAEDLHTRLGDALANAGRGVDAALAYQEAARLSKGLTAVRHRARAGEQLLRSGHVDEGIELLRGALGEVGITLPRSSRTAQLLFIWERIRARFRRKDASLQERSELSWEERTRLEICAASAPGLAMCSTFLGAHLQSRFVREAYRAGEPGYLACATALEASMLSFKGPSARPKVKKVLDKAREYSSRADDPYTRAYVIGNGAFTKLNMGRWREALRESRTTSNILVSRCRGAWFEIGCMKLYSVLSLFALGKTQEFSRLVVESLYDADKRGDLFLKVAMSTGWASRVWLLGDDSEHARRLADHALAHWSKRSYQLQHYWHLEASRSADLYDGHAMMAWQRVENEWSSIESSYLLNIPLIRMDALMLYARVGLAAAQEGNRWLILARVDAAIRKLLKAPNIPYGQGNARLLAASSARQRGAMSDVRDLLREASDIFEKNQLILMRVITQRSLGAVEGGEDGRKRMAEADAWLVQHGVVKPDRFCRMMAPGLEP